MNLSQEQMDAIDAIVNGTGDLAITAPAGAGKTDVACRGVIEAVRQKKVKAEQVLFISFSRAAMTSIQERMVSANLPEEGDRLAKNVCTFASHALRHADLTAYHTDWCIDIQKTSIKNHLLERARQCRDGAALPRRKDGSFETVNYNKLTPGCTTLLRASAMALAEGIDLAHPSSATWCLQNGFPADLQKAWAVYNNQLDKNGLWSFDQLARHHYRNAIGKYKWIIIDEAQDTTKFQLDTARRWLMPGGRLILIGDIRQSIHGWRGVKVEHFYDFIQQSQHQPLTSNFRSPPEIVDRANALLQNQSWSAVSTQSARASKPDAAIRAPRVDAYAAIKSVVDAIRSGKTVDFNVAILARTHMDLDWVQQMFENMGLDSAHYFRKAAPQYAGDDEDDRKRYIEGRHKFLLSTIHGVKGLGFDTVFVLQTEDFSYDDMIERIKKNRNVENYAEEFRLMYTAMTRAKETLVLVEQRNLPANPWPV